MIEKEKKSNPLWRVVKEEWRHLGDKKKIFFISMSLFTIAGIINLLNPLVIGLIFNSIQQSITSQADLRKLIYMICLLLAIEVGFWIFHGTGRILEQLTGFYVHKNYTNSKIHRVLELPVKWHKDHHSGDTIDKINRGRNALVSFSSDITSSIVYAILNIFGSLIILFFVDVRIAIFTFTFSCATLFVIMKVDKKLIKYYDDLNKFSNKLSTSIFDYLSNIITILTLRLKKTASKEINTGLNASFETSKKTFFLDEFKWGFASMAITFMVVLALSFKVYSDYTTTGIILIGTLYMLYGYLRKVGNTFFNFASLYGRIVRQDSRIRGAKPIDEAFDEIKTKIKGTLPKDWKQVELKKIDFTYNKEGEKQHIDKINLKFKRGEKIALIGKSGSGKSTILALMRGLYSPEKGKVYSDGKEIENGFEKLKRDITLIPQDPEIFNNTIKHNITMDFPVKKDELEKVISMARFSKVVERLDKGVNTSVLEKGVSLSGGEKQRLALARGLLAAKESNIVLLDEPTSSVDSLNEMEIHKNIFAEFKEKTIIASIHRLHLLNEFDYVYMFEDGKIVAKGTLNEIKRNPRFMRIWRKYGMRKEM